MHTTLLVLPNTTLYCSTVLHYCGWEAERCQDGQLHGDRHLCACCMSREQPGGLTGMLLLFISTSMKYTTKFSWTGILQTRGHSLWNGSCLFEVCS